jgi:uncharacterized protein (TIGR02265 family)
MDNPHLVFAQTVEGLSRGLGARLTPDLKLAIKECGINLDKLEPAYPSAVWSATLRLCAGRLYPELPPEVALRHLGSDVMTGFFGTLIGRAMQTALRVIGPLRALRRFTRSMRSADNFVEGRLTERGPTEAEIWISDDNGIPDYVAGVLETAGRLIGAKECTAVVLARTPPSSTFRINWLP